MNRNPPATPTQAAYRHNGRLVSPQRFYAIACDPRRSVVVQACAGAGKTWMLVSRIVRALLEGASGGAGELQPDEILAITFTKRAAGEMRERLYSWLAEFARATPEQLLAELQARGVDVAADPQRAAGLAQALAQLHQRVLQNGRPVQVRTFHSWFAALLRLAPLAVLAQMQLPAQYELLEDDAPAQALVWRRFYRALLDAPALRADFDAVVQAHGRAQALKALQTILDKRIEFALADEQGLVASSVQRFGDQFPEWAHLGQPEEAFVLDAPLQAVLQAAACALSAASAPTFAAKGQALAQASASGDGPNIRAALLTQEGSPRKFGKKMAGLEAVAQAQDAVLRVQAAQQQHEAWLYQQQMTRLSRLLLAEFAALKREHGWVDMADLERAALLMLRDPVLSGWLQERLDARIKHLLIDEFQDTNPLQWQALSAWLSAYAGAAAQAPSVFVVGDPKQSIYRFRRAQPQIFQAAQTFVREVLQGDCLSCDHTRRNAGSIVATVNAVMGALHMADRWPDFRPHTTQVSEPGAVLALPQITRPMRQGGNAPADIDLPWRDSLCTPRAQPEETLQTQEARQAAAWIAAQLGVAADPSAPLQPQDVMVLSRKRAHLRAMHEALRARHIAAHIGEKTALMDCCEVQDLVALLDVLISPQHDLSLARVLKSPLFAMTDDALVQLALAQRQSPRSWFEQLQNQATVAPDGRPIGAVLLRWQAWLSHIPPHDALQAIYDDGDVLARFVAAAPPSQKSAVLANLQALLGSALQLAGGRFSTPYALVRALKAGALSAPATAPENAVRLLTIHGAKGLEARVVLLLDTDAPERAADTMSVLVDWPGQLAWPQKLVFLASETHPPGCALPALENERAERQREEWNAWYVALTRARHTLVLSSVAPHRAAEQSAWQRLIACDQVVLAGAPAAVAATAVPEAAAFQLKTLPPFAQRGLPQRAGPVSDAASDSVPDAAAAENFAQNQPNDVAELSARIGSAMHRLLQWGQPTAANRQAVAREFALNASQAEQAARAAQHILQGEGAWAWNASELLWQGNEVELIHQGQTLRLDRLVLRRAAASTTAAAESPDQARGATWWVLDYKSAPAPQTQAALRAQLLSYRAAVQAAYPAAAVKAAFLTAQGALIEIQD